MYFLFLILIALFLISILSTNWPVKVYHHFLLTKIAQIFNAVPERKGLIFSNVYSQINLIYHERQIRIRFMEASVDSLRANSGLEIRTKIATQVVMEFYRFDRSKREWGDFKRFTTNDLQLDSEWFILTNDLTSSREFWDSFKLRQLLSEKALKQLLINREEIICQLSTHSPERVKNFIDLLIQAV